MQASIPYAVPISSRELALEVFALLRELDPAGWRDDLTSTVRERLQRVTALIHELLSTAPTSEVFAGLHERLSELSQLLDEYTTKLDLGANECRETWMRLRSQLSLRYDALARTLREFEVHVPSLRPTNYKRNVFHLASAVFSLLLVEVFLSQSQLVVASAAFTLGAWSTELARRRWPRLNQALMWMLGAIAHPHEHWRVNSATWYSSAIFLLACTGEPIVQIAAVMILGVSDPLAAIIGRRYGRHKLVHGRSLEGSLTFLFSGIIAATVLLISLHSLPLTSALLISAGAALPATLAELFSRRIDDNFSIPVSAAAGAWLTLQLLTS